MMLPQTYWRQMHFIALWVLSQVLEKCTFGTRHFCEWPIYLIKKEKDQSQYLTNFFLCFVVLYWIDSDWVKAKFISIILWSNSESYSNEGVNCYVVSVFSGHVNLLFLTQSVSFLSKDCCSITQQCEM